MTQLIPSRWLQLSAMVMLACASQSSFAQLSQLGGGGTTGGGGGGAATSATAAGVGGASTGTTEGISGITTQGLPGGDATGGTAGANIAEAFVGGNADGAFVGGGLQTQRNNNRQFRAITPVDVPTGGNAQATGTPRRIPVSLRIGFSYPQPDATTLLIEPSGPAIGRVSLFRPELQNVRVTLSPDGTATLVGQAPDANSRRLAANLVRLRPGIRRVENKLLIPAK